MTKKKNYYKHIIKDKNGKILTLNSNVKFTYKQIIEELNTSLKDFIYSDGTFKINFEVCSYKIGEENENEFQAIS